MSDPHDRDEDALRAAFSSGVPTPPGAPDRASGARRVARRARRRRTAGVVAAAVAAVAAVAVVPAVLGPDGGAPQPAAPTSTAVPTPTPAPRDCPGADADASTTGPAALGTDVVAVRLCTGYSERPTAPAGVLTGDDAAALVELVEAAPVFAQQACPDNLGDSFRLFFDRADGSSQLLVGRLYGCQTFTLGGVNRDGAGEILRAARAAIAAQPVPEVTCPDDPVVPPSTGPGDVAAGAVVVRLCRGPGLPFQEPLDQLTSTRVAALVELINAEPGGPQHEGCRSDLGPGFALVFGYPDGSTQQLTGELRGCRDLRVGSTSRDDPGRVLDAFRQALVDQRAQTDERDIPYPDPSLDCSAEAETISLLERTGGQAVICVGDPEPAEGILLDDDENVTITYDLQRTGVPDPPTEGCGDKPPMSLVITNQWGDRFVVPSVCGWWQVAGNFIKPTPLSQTRIDRLIARATSGD